MMMRYIVLLSVSLFAVAQTVMGQTYDRLQVWQKDGAINQMLAEQMDKATLKMERPFAMEFLKKDGTSVSVGLDNLDKVDFNTLSIDEYLQGLMGFQYYGLPYNNAILQPNSASPYVGKFDALTDCYQLHWSPTQVFSKYYTGELTAEDTPLMSYTKDYVWETVNNAYALLEDLDRLEGVSQSQKAYVAAQAKCVIAMRYFDLFVHYGGLPIVKESVSPSRSLLAKADGSFYMERDDRTNPYVRADVETTVNYMVSLLDEAIPYLEWECKQGNGLLLERLGYDKPMRIGTAYSTNWSKAGAMALKAKILVFAASPLFNNSTPYYNGESEAEKNHLVWYGNYDSVRWDRALRACQEFFDALAANGHYALRQATGNTCDAYRHAYRMGYLDVNSPEALHATCVASIYGAQGTYSWLSWGWHQNGVNRNSYSPTEEYVEMFPWKDGTPFDWDKDYAAGNIDGANGRLFYSYTPIRGGFKKEASRDPRLYENAFVNGQQLQLGWEDGKSTGGIFESWVGGYHAQNDVINSDGTVNEALTTICPTGYGCVKYLADEQYHRKPMFYITLSLSEMYLLYAEALAQCGNNAEAVRMVDVVRSRVGLGSLTMGKPEIATNKNALVEEILRERACELGMSNARFNDMVRYKRTDWMTKTLHGLAVYRMHQNGEGTWTRVMRPWYGDDKNSGTKEPNRFEYEKFVLQQGTRVLWGKDPNSVDVKKWLLSPLPSNMVNEGKGLVQNPGW